jgi:hypothetical protein
MRRILLACGAVAAIVGISVPPAIADDTSGTGPTRSYLVLYADGA